MASSNDLEKDQSQHEELKSPCLVSGRENPLKENDEVIQQVRQILNEEDNTTPDKNNSDVLDDDRDVERYLSSLAKSERKIVTAAVNIEQDESKDGDQKDEKLAEAEKKDANENDNEDEDDKDKKFDIGDHVYMWCSLVGIPYMFQHHGIVVHVSSDDGKVTIADFSGMISASAGIRSSGGDQAQQQQDEDRQQRQQQQQGQGQQQHQHEDRRQQRDGQDREQQQEEVGTFFPWPEDNAEAARQEGQELTTRAISSPVLTRSTSSMREYAVEESVAKTKWRKVKYKSGWVRRLFQSAGTCTSVDSDPPGLVLARVQFLLSNSHMLPKYHVFKANCECVAVWCKTGVWSTLQASSFLHVTGAGQVKGTATLAMLVAGKTVTTTVPAAGVWGWFGATTTTTVPLLALNPWLIPLIAGYGIFTVGGPYWILYRSRDAWHKTTTNLNDGFWSKAVDKPEIFVDCIMNWSSIGE